MTNTDIANRADFSRIRYAQVWEDADILVAALRPKRGDTIVSIASAGDNCLALLAEDVGRVIAVDLNPAQLACLRLRIAAMQSLSHQDYLQLMGSRPSTERAHLLARSAVLLSEEDQRFWEKRRCAIAAHGLGGVGKFENYFRLFRSYVLPLAHGRRTIEELLLPKDEAMRSAFYEKHWRTPRWNALMRAFFSPAIMGRLGRDPAFFDHAEGDLAAQLEGLIARALAAQDPSANPYLHWILRGRHGEALPRALTPEGFERARTRLVRLQLRQCALEDLAEDGVRADAFNLSDIFEYMGPEAHARAYDCVLSMAKPGARIAYWNMMAPRRAPKTAPVRTRNDLEAELKPRDKAFFYRDFVIEEAA